MFGIIKQIKSVSLIITEIKTSDEAKELGLIHALGILKKFGLRADAVANGLEALHSLQTLPYDLVLMDVQMPELDGLVATREFRRLEDERMRRLQSESNPGIPIIALTAGAMQEDRERCFEAGMDDYLAKPINPMELARVLEKWLPDVGCRKAGGEEQAREEGALPVFDRTALLKRLMGDEDLIQEMQNLFLKKISRHILELQAALDVGDAPAACLAAHTIKGMAANMGAEALSALAGTMEAEARAGNLDAARARMGALAERFEELREVLV